MVRDWHGATTFSNFLLFWFSSNPIIIKGLLLGWRGILVWYSCRLLWLRDLTSGITSYFLFDSVFLFCSNLISDSFFLGDGFISLYYIVQTLSNLLHKLNQFWVFFVIQHILLQLLHFFHFEILEALQLWMASDRINCFSDQLLDSNRYVFVDEVLDCTDLIQLVVQLFIDLIELDLNFHFLLLKVRFILFGVL